MTVGELICELRKYPPDIPVSALCEYDCGYGLTGGRNIEVGLDADGNELYLYVPDTINSAVNIIKEIRLE